MSKTRGTNFDIFVGNVPPSGEEKSVRDLFSQYGEIKDIFMPESKKPSPTGAKIAFVHYTCEEDANNAIEGKNGFSWNGNVLLVRKSDKWLKRIKDAGGNANPSAFVPKTIKSSHQLKKEKYEQANYNASNGTSKNMASSSNYGAYPGDTTCYGESTKSFHSSGDERQLYSMKLCLSHLVDPICFFAHVQNDYDDNQLMELQAELQMVCNNAPPVSEKLSYNKIYATKFSEDDTWYRCTVESVDNYLSTAKVNYIDFGNFEQVQCNSIVELPHHLTAIPVLAFQCKLCDVNIAEGVYQQAMDEFQEIIKGKLLHASGFRSNNGHSECYMVVNLEFEGFNIIAHLIDSGYLIRCKTPLDPIPIYDKRGIKDRKRDPCSEKMEKSQMAYNVGNRMNQKMGNNFKGLGKKNNYAFGSNSSISEYSIGPSMLMSQIDSLKLDLSREKGKSEALESRCRKLQAQQQKPDILSQCDVFSQITSLFNDIPRVTLMRQQLPIGPGMGINQDCVETAIRLLWKGKEQPTPTVDEQLLKSVNDKNQLYCEIQNEIFECQDKMQLPDLLCKRNELRLELHSQLKSFCDLVEGMPLQERVNQLEAVLIELEKTYQPFLKMRTTAEDIPIQLQDLVLFYRKIREECKPKFREIQFHTNQAHSALMESLDSLSKGLRLTVHKNVLSRKEVPRHEFSEQQLHKAVRELKKCLHQEFNECNLEHGNHASVVAILTQQLYKELSIELNKVKQLSISEELYRRKYEEITPWLNAEPDMQRIVELRKETKKIRSKFRHKLADKSDLEESEEKDEAAIQANISDLNSLRFELQKKFNEDNMEMQQIVTYYHSVFPELNLLFPDLRLEQYYKYGGLVKYIRQIEYYNIERVLNKMGIDCYISTFLNMPITLKQYLTDGDQMQEALLMKAKEYSTLQCENLLKIDAIFFSSNCRLAYVQQERYDSWLDRAKTQTISLEEKLLVLSGILQGLRTLHSANLIHGCLHPDTVFTYGQTYAILDSIPLLESKLQNLTLPIINGINFQCPRLPRPCAANDIYAFFCIALWFFFPDTHFTVNDFGVPDLTLLDVPPELVEYFPPIYKFLNSVPAEYPTVSELLTNYCLFGSQNNNFVDDGNNQDVLTGNIPEQIVCFEDLESVSTVQEHVSEESLAASSHPAGSVRASLPSGENDDSESSDDVEKDDESDDDDEEEESQEDSFSVNGYNTYRDTNVCTMGETSLKFSSSDNNDFD